MSKLTLLEFILDNFFKDYHIAYNLHITKKKGINKDENMIIKNCTSPDYYTFDYRR